MATPDNKFAAQKDPLPYAIAALVIYAALAPLVAQFFPFAWRWGGLAQIYLIGVVVVLHYRLQRSWSELGLGCVSVKQEMAIGFTAFLVPLLVVLIVAWLGNSEAGAVVHHKKFSIWKQLLHPILVGGVLAPLAEELFFRGVLNRAYWRGPYPLPLAAWPGEWRRWLPALLFLATVFMLAHLKIALGPFLLGLATSALTLWRGSVFSAITLHSLCNLVGPVLYLGFPHAYKALQAFFI